MLSGTIISQIINFLALPFITMLYGVKGFGFYSIILSSVYILTPLATLKYELGIFTTDNKRKREHLVTLGFLLTLIVSIITFLICFLFPDLINQIIDDNNFGANFYIYIPLLLFGVATFQIISLKFFSESRFFEASSIKIVEVISFIFLAYILKNYYDGLILAKIIPYILIFIIFWIWYKPKWFQNNLFDTVKEFRHQPLFLFPAHTLNALSRELPTILFTFYFGIEFAAVYALSNRFIRIPVAFLGQAIGDVFRTKAMNLIQTKNKISNLYRKTFFSLLAASSVFLFIILFFVDFIILNFFTDEWKQTIEVIKILSIIGAFQLVSNPLGSVFIITNNQKYDFYWQISLSVFVISSIIVGSLFFDAYQTLNLFAIAYSLSYLINLIISYNLSR